MGCQASPGGERRTRSRCFARRPAQGSKDGRVPRRRRDAPRASYWRTSQNPHRGGRRGAAPVGRKNRLKGRTMIPRFKTLVVLAAGVVLLAVSEPAPGQDTATSAGSATLSATWTDRSGEHRTEAAFMDFKEGKVTLEEGRHGRITVSLESLSDADRQYVKHRSGANRASGAVEEVGPAAGPKDRVPLSQNSSRGKVAAVEYFRWREKPHARLGQRRERSSSPGSGRTRRRRHRTPSAKPLSKPSAFWSMRKPWSKMTNSSVTKY